MSSPDGPRPVSRLTAALAWPRSAVAFLFLSLYVLLVGPVALAVAARTGRPALIVELALVAVRTTRRLLGLRLVVEGLERVVGDRPAVYCINHESNVDVVVVEALFPRCPRLKAFYKAELGHLPVFGRLAAAVDFIGVERGNRPQTSAAVEGAIERLRRGDSFVLAPEGTRSPTGELRPFKRGAFVMAIGAGVPVVPIGITGGRAAMPKGSAVARAGLIRVRIGEPIPTDRLTGSDLAALIAATQSRIDDLRQPDDRPVPGAGRTAVARH